MAPTPFPALPRLKHRYTSIIDAGSWYKIKTSWYKIKTPWYKLARFRAAFRAIRTGLRKWLQYRAAPVAPGPGPDPAAGSSPLSLSLSISRSLSLSRSISRSLALSLSLPHTHSLSPANGSNTALPQWHPGKVLQQVLHFSTTLQKFAAVPRRARI